MGIISLYANIFTKKEWHNHYHPSGFAEPCGRGLNEVLWNRGLSNECISRSLLMVDAQCRLMRILIAICLLLLSNFTYAAEKADMVLVVKSQSRLFLIKNGKPFKEYRVVFGAEPKGPKEREGDERTPEGKYFLDYKKVDSAFYKAIHISYPNEADKKRAKKLGVNPGGLIMIHGQKNGFGWLSWVTQHFNWTDGCIAVTNSAMDAIWESVDAGTPIEINP